MVGPYWPFCIVLTTNLIVVIPTVIIVIFWGVLPRGLLLAFLGASVLTLLALGSVGCRNPGLLLHYPDEPEQSKAEAPGTRPSKKWIFNDLTQSWRPRGVQYDRDVNALVEGFDHVCPFTGTAIGANNLSCFYSFTVSVQILIYFAIGVACYGFYTMATDGFSPP
jgi:hypothetical protein